MKPQAPLRPACLVALPGGAAMTDALATRLGWPQHVLEVHRFPDAETLVRLDASLAGQDVVLVGSLDRPDEKTMGLIFTAELARELGAARVGLVSPYLAYMRQDARFRPGEAITSASYARLLSDRLDFLVTVDPHLHRWNSLAQIYRIPTRVVAAAPFIAQWVRAHASRPLLVGPDEESAQWVSHVADLCGAPWVALKKTRRGDRDVSVAWLGTREVQGRKPILIDDIGSTGHTLVAAAQALRTMGLAAPDCVIVHALLSEAGAEMVRAGGVARLLSCDTVPHPSNAIGVADGLAVAVRELLVQ